MTRKPDIEPPATIKNWIRVNLGETRAAMIAIDGALPFSSEKTDKTSLLRIQNAMRVLVAESQALGIDGLKRRQVVKAG